MDKVDWEGLKSAYALILVAGTFEEKHALRKQLGDVLLTAFPNLLAAHEKDQRVIAAAEKFAPLLLETAKALKKWHVAYGEHQPKWLPPAFDVMVLEDVAAALAEYDKAKQA